MIAKQPCETCIHVAEGETLCNRGIVYSKVNHSACEHYEPIECYKIERVKMWKSHVTGKTFGSYDAALSDNILHELKGEFEDEVLFSIYRGAMPESATPLTCPPPPPGGPIMRNPTEFFVRFDELKSFIESNLEFAQRLIAAVQLGAKK